jgi:asparagine synthase (glutamine-hydrolysing)
MASLPRIDPALSWFVMVPDTDAGAALVDPPAPRLPGLRVITHASGRPWLVGRWTDGEVAVGEQGDRRLAVLGEHRLTGPDLWRLAAGTADPGQWCAAVAASPGSFHVAVSADGATHLHGTLSGYRRVYFGRAGAVTLAADRADVVAALLDAPVDADRLTLRLLAPYAPWPLFWQPVWRGVEALRPDQRLVLGPDAAPRTVTRWHPPEPTLGLAEAADGLRRALADAVGVRTAAGGVVSTDLSGTDSTALCALAATGRADVVALTSVSVDPLDDDLPWATRAVQALGTVRHEVVPAEENPLPYTGALDGADRFDEPTAAVMYRASFLALSDRAAAHGARVRLTGFGGDELLTADPGLQLTLLRTHPRTAWRQLRVMRAAYRWPRGTVLRAVLDRRGYADWMTTLARGLTAGWPATDRPPLGWELPIGVAPWTTPDGVAALRRLLAATAAHATPIAADAGTHNRLAAIHAGAANTRHMAQLTAGNGVPMAAPYLDDAVVTACLAVRLADVTDPGRYKPLLRAAMRDVLPAPLLERSGKADTSIAAERGALAYRDRLLDLAEDSRLAERGLVDPARLRAALRSPGERTWYELDQTLACETWLRTLDTVPTRL